MDSQRCCYNSKDYPFEVTVADCEGGYASRACALFLILCLIAHGRHLRHHARRSVSYNSALFPALGRALSTSLSRGLPRLDIPRCQCTLLEWQVHSTCGLYLLSSPVSENLFASYLQPPVIATRLGIDASAPCSALDCTV